VEMRSGLTDVAIAPPNYFVVCRSKGQGARTDDGKGIPLPPGPAGGKPPRP
jgi:hypothetical protein